ncbi:hypothetical protein ACM66B_006296 [Microbotryomycetes sp. NB124-2]
MKWPDFRLLSLVWLLATGSSSDALQIVFEPKRQVTWFAAGPFPVGTRETTTLPPLLADLNTSTTLLGPYGHVSKFDVIEDANGWVSTSLRHINWSALRKSAGWSVLQHRVYYERRLQAQESGLYSFTLTGASELSLLRSGKDERSRHWYKGDVYSQNSLPRFVNLEQGEYLVTVTAAYDVRVHGDPGLTSAPAMKWRLQITNENISRPTVTDQVVPDLVEHRLMGEFASFVLPNPGDRSIEVTAVTALTEEVKARLDRPVRISSHQSRPVTLKLDLKQPLRSDVDSIKLCVQFRDRYGRPRHLDASLPLRRLSLKQARRSGFASTFVTNGGVASYAVYTPPTLEDCSRIVLLALHGAGVEPRESPFWTQSIRTRKHEWIVWPLGLAPWGFDWHGPSLSDVDSAVQHLDQVRSYWLQASKTAQREPLCETAQQLFVLGHSNGGQGAWYFMSRFPDRVIGGVPASGYVKIQDYVPYHLSVASHYRDPVLTGILQSSLSSFDNDLHASNLQGIPVLARHGTDDDNVPVCHSRQMVDTIAQWHFSNGISNTSTILSEVANESHWFDDVLNSNRVNRFISDVVKGRILKRSASKFTVTTVNPDETGTVRGFRIRKVDVPGRVARLQVELLDVGAAQLDCLVRTSNVRAFEVDSAAVIGDRTMDMINIKIDGQDPIRMNDAPQSLVTFAQKDITPSTKWTMTERAMPARRYGPLQSILKTSKPLLIVTGTLNKLDVPHLVSVAQRVAHDVLVYARLDSEFVTDTELLQDLESTYGRNLVLLGDSYQNALTATFAAEWTMPVKYLSPSAFQVHDRIFQEADEGIIYIIEHRFDPQSMALVVSGNSEHGLELAHRLFPLQTGVTVPEWAVVSSDLGVQAAGFWTHDWKWSDKMSYLP